MGKRSGRDGKHVSAGHHLLVEGLKEFIPVLAKWDEIETIRTGQISNAKPTNSSRGHTYAIGRDKPRSVGLGGGFSFRVNRWAQVGERITGIKCTASFGRSHQEVVLTSSDYRALRARLTEEGYLE